MDGESNRENWQGRLLTRRNRSSKLEISIAPQNTKLQQIAYSQALNQNTPGVS